MRHIRGNEISMIFQEPMTSLNPVFTVGDQIAEAIELHQRKSHKEALEDAVRLLDAVRIHDPHKRVGDYPHQLSGGMRQRVMISLALALRTKLVIADEPTTSLDVIVEAKFLDLLRELRDEFDLTILMITHNIGVVAEISDRVAVMYAGRMAEIGNVYGVFGDAKHPYTVGLLSSVPNIDLKAHDLYKMEGAPPNLLSPPSGCPFHPRCPKAMDVCTAQIPVLREVTPDHSTACWLYEQAEVPGG